MPFDTALVFTGITSETLASLFAEQRDLENNSIKFTPTYEATIKA
jgi:hypothetical protein